MEIPKWPPGAIRFRDHVERTGPRTRGLAYNSSLFHLEELGLGGGQLVWVQAAALGKDWRTRDGREVMENTILQSGGIKSIGGEDIRVL